MSKRAVIYCRISRDREGSGLGTERQQRECRELADRLGLTVDHVYVDDDVSAYSGKPRPRYRALLDEVTAGRVGTVLVWHTDRLHRAPAELETWIAAAEPHGVVVRPVRAGELDLATAAGRLTARIVGSVARHESELKGERIRAQKRQARDAGRWLGGRRPFGYAADGRTLIAAEADLIATGTAALLAGGSLRGVVRMWAAAGVPTSTGRGWTHRSASAVLGRWRNAGQHEPADGEGLGGPAEWPACRTVDGAEVTAEQVRAVRDLLADNAAAHAGVNTVGNRARWLLSGIALCPCGAPLRCVTSTARGRVLRCTVYGPGHVSRVAEPVEALVNAVMVRRLARGDVAELLAPEEVGPDQEAARGRRRAARRRLDEIAAMLGDGDLTAAQARTATARARARLDEADAVLAGAARTSPLARVVDPAGWWVDPATDLDDRRAVLRALLRVTVLRQGPGRRPFDPSTVVIEAVFPGAL